MWERSQKVSITQAARIEEYEIIQDDLSPGQSGRRRVCPNDRQGCAFSSFLQIDRSLGGAQKSAARDADGAIKQRLEQP
jgi:hypothetical protein